MYCSLQEPQSLRFLQFKPDLGRASPADISGETFCARHLQSDGVFRASPPLTACLPRRRNFWCALLLCRGASLTVQKRTCCFEFVDASARIAELEAQLESKDQQLREQEQERERDKEKEMVLDDLHEGISTEECLKIAQKWKSNVEQSKREVAMMKKKVYRRKEVRIMDSSGEC